MADARILIVALVSLFAFDRRLVHANFANDTVPSWGAQNVRISADGENLTLTLTNQTGCRIDTVNRFMFGSIEMNIKLVAGNSAGTVTSYYMSSDGSAHDEIDFEFLGNSTGQPYIIHTNIYTQGMGKKEQQFYPWFDPTSSFHNYTIHWNPSEIVWFVDGTPIRVFRNYESLGIPYPSKQAMKAYSSIWNGEAWATRGGRVKIDWGSAPFVAGYARLGLRACVWDDAQCVSTYPASTLTPDQKTQMANIRGSYMIYDYCKDTSRFNGTMPPECSQPQDYRISSSSSSSFVCRATSNGGISQVQAVRHGHDGRADSLFHGAAVRRGRGARPQPHLKRPRPVDRRRGPSLGGCPRLWLSLLLSYVLTFFAVIYLLILPFRFDRRCCCCVCAHWWKGESAVFV